jgi:hypothetical protein
MMFENKELGRIFGTKRKEIARELRKFRDEEI